jgi:uncharacterized OsmC-like protein
MSTDVIEATIKNFQANPAAALTAPEVTASVVNGHARLSAGRFEWECDLPPAIGGENLAPSPTAYLLGALAGCAVVFIRDTLAPQLGLQIDDVSAVARCVSDLRGLLALDDAAPDLDQIAIELRVVSPEPPERLERLYQAWLERCPIYLALTKPNSVQASFVTEESASD